MNAAREWTTQDKGAWGAGPWVGEPDKIQWVDESTGLDCLMVRGPGGHWCGYVGVGPDHPWHGIDYTGCTVDGCSESWCDHSPSARTNVHGGLTFASGCQEPTEEKWREHRAKAESPALIAEAAKYPNGDAAERLAGLREQAAMSFPEWVEYTQARAICHVPLPGRPDDVWWFGFDCAHGGDFAPKYADRFGGGFRSGYEVYRGRAYVEGEIRALATQLATYAAPARATEAGA